MNLSKPNTELLQSLLDQHQLLIAAHRGLSQGNIVENTIAAMRAGFAAGADIVEMDVVASSDGDFYVFHDRSEARLFHDANLDIRDCSSKAIEQLRYFNTIGEPTETGVDRLADFIHALPSNKLMNLDRGWPYLDTLLPYLDEFDLTQRLLLKTRATEEHLSRVARHPIKYMFFAICRTESDVELAMSHAKFGLNLVGLELIADHPAHPFLQGDYLASVKSQGYLLLVNTLNLGDGMILWGDYDDDLSVTHNPEDGWGKVMRQGVDIINTDWPGLLANYRSTVRQLTKEQNNYS